MIQTGNLVSSDDSKKAFTIKMVHSQDWDKL